MCADKLVQGEVAALLGKVVGADALHGFRLCGCSLLRLYNHSTLNNFSSALSLMPRPSVFRAARCGISQFLQSSSAAALSPEPPSPSLLLPAAAAAAFVSEISASDFASGGSSAGGGSIFGAIADVDVKVAALNECVRRRSSCVSSCRQSLENQTIFHHFVFGVLEMKFVSFLLIDVRCFTPQFFRRFLRQLLASYSEFHSKAVATGNMIHTCIHTWFHIDPRLLFALLLFFIFFASPFSSALVDATLPQASRTAFGSAIGRWAIELRSCCC